MTGERISRDAAVATAVCRVALLGMVLVLIVIAYFPFAWDPPRTVRNEVTRSADGSLRFGEMNNARTPGTPAWLRGCAHIWRCPDSDSSPIRSHCRRMPRS